jgi:hypothetical protein
MNTSLPKEIRIERHIRKHEVTINLKFAMHNIMGYELSAFLP